MPLVVGDSREEIPKITAEVHAVVCDPPADIGYLTKDKWAISDRHSLLVDILTAARAKCVPGAFALVWSLPKESHRVAVCLEDAGWVVKDQIAHHFGTGQPKSGGLKPATEFWVLAQNGTGRKLNIEECYIKDPKAVKPKKWSSPRGGFWKAEEGKKANLITNEKGRWPSNAVFDEFMLGDLPRYFYVRKTWPASKFGHPTSKAVDLMEYLVRLVSYEGETVLDPFAGSGSTGVACKTTGREFIGIEKDPTYAAIAARRLQKED